MKNILKFKIALSSVFMVLFISSCSLDEFNPSTTDLEIAYSNRTGYESLVNYCYDGLYYFYGKIDGIGAMEMGTDLWFSESKEKGFCQYGSDMTTELGTLKVLWQGFYSTINYCNLAIYYSNNVKGYPNDAERNAKTAEAYFLRGWSNLTIVEQFGGVVLNSQPSAISGFENAPKRSSEAEFYNLIISDLKFACDHLPASQSERGRVTKKAAYGMLAKAYLQRIRLGEANAADYAKSALDAAKEIIENPVNYNCDIYTSNDTVSGYTQLWKGENNKDNKEFLFIQAVDQATFLNPDGDNRGRTRQYYEMDLRTIGAEWGTTEKNCSWYGRANDRGFKPSKYLMTEIFEPVKDPADTRFDETFFTQYYNSRWSDFTINSALATKYGKDASIVGKVIKNTAGTYTANVKYFSGKCYYTMNASGNTNMVDNNSDGYLDGLSVFTPNYVIPTDEKAKLPFLCVDPTDMFNSDGKWVTASDLPLGFAFKDCYPSMRKFSSIYWIYNNQKWQGDVPILRLGDVYLLAAEAALRYNNDQVTAAGYVNTLRQRAAVTVRASEMTVSSSEVTLDFILAERARELAGEQVRWADLKRFGKLTKAYLEEKNPNIVNFDDAKNKVRPIPQSFLDAISNPDEFGTNGY